jgi:hypothetical protein
VCCFHSTLFFVKLQQDALSTLILFSFFTSFVTLSLSVSSHTLSFSFFFISYEISDPGKNQDVAGFAKFYTARGLNSCYGNNPNPKNYTTFHARTYLQPQLNKAIKYSEKDIKGDKNPKDFILFDKSQFLVLSTTKDNTGDRNYVEGMVFPTLAFPSDHGITATALAENPIGFQN